MNFLDLALNTSEAAVDISNVILGNNLDINYQNINRISKYLYNISESDRIDPTESLMLAKAIWPNKEDWKGKRDDDLKLQIGLFVKDLELLIELPIERQEILRDACVDLSKSSLNYSRELRGTRKHLAA